MRRGYDSPELYREDFALRLIFYVERIKKRKLKKPKKQKREERPG